MFELTKLINRPFSVRAKNAFAIILIFSLVFGVYLSALKLNFLFWDDYEAVKTSFKSVTTLALSNCYGIHGKGGFYRPLSLLSTKLDHWLWQINPFGYHLTNVLFHAINACLVFLIGLQMQTIFLFALSSAALFAVLPVNAEAVNWISARVDLIFSFFFLLSFLFFQFFLKKPSVKFLTASLTCFTFSLFTKESALVLPLVAFIYARLYNAHKPLLKTLYIYLLIFVAYFSVRWYSLGGPIGGYQFSLLKEVASFLLGPFKLIQLVFLPFVQENLTLYFILLPIISICLVLAICIYIKRRSPTKLFYFSLFWVFITLLPTWYILSIGFDFKSSRYLYLPSVGIAWLLGHFAFLGTEKLPTRTKRLLLAVYFLFFIYSVFFLLQINKVWTTTSNRALEMKRQALSIAQQYPEGTEIFFWNVPFRFKGCNGGLPYFEPPFYRGKYLIRGYKPDYMFIDEIAGDEAKRSVHYYYVLSARRFEKTSYFQVSSERIPISVDENSNAQRIKEFLRKYSGR